MSNFALSQEGAKKLHAYLEERPHLKDKLGKSFQTAPGTFLKDACEIGVDDVNSALGTQFRSGAEAHDAIGGNIALGLRQSSPRREDRLRLPHDGPPAHGSHQRGKSRPH